MERLANLLLRGFATNGRAVAAGKTVGLAGTIPARPVGSWWMFLCLAALYESWTIPLAVLLTVRKSLGNSMMSGLDAEIVIQAERCLNLTSLDLAHASGHGAIAIIVCQMRYRQQHRQGMVQLS